jgi:hypothetical protein
MNNIQDIRNKLEQQKGQLTQVKVTISENKKLLREEKRKLKKHDQAREIMRIVALKTQEQIQYHIGDLTSMALEAVDDDPYQLEVELSAISISLGVTIK